MKKILFGLAATPFFLTLLTAGQLSLTVLPYSSAENDGSYYVGLTQGYLTDTTTSQSSSDFFMYCVDFLGDIYPPTSYNITLVSLDSTSFTNDNPPGINLSLAQLQTQYLLGLDFGTSPSGNSAQDSDIQHALWNFTGGSFTLGAYASGQLATAECETGEIASTDPSCATITPIASNASIYSNAYLMDVTDSTGQQAFMAALVPRVAETASPIPEPTTFVLFGTGLLACCVWRFRSRATAAAR